MSRRPLAQLIAAEWRRRWSVHPWSTFFSTVFFPALMVTLLFYLPRADVSETSLELRPAAYQIVGEGAHPPEWAASVLDALAAQPVFSFEAHGDALAAFKAGDVAAAALITRGAGGVEVTVHHHDDLVSHLLLDQLAKVDEAGRAPVFIEEGAEGAKVRESRDNLARVGLFILLGFAWFFISSGVIERLVSERERRSMEALLCLPVPLGDLVRGRLSEITLHASWPQLACGGALIALGFPAASLLLPFLVMLSLYPIAFFCFWVLYKSEDVVSASWKTGVSFMFAFPLLILTSDVLGPLSPFYRLGRALSGDAPWAVFIPVAAVLVAFNAASWLLTPVVAARWRL